MRLELGNVITIRTFNEDKGRSVGMAIMITWVDFIQSISLLHF